MRLGFFFERVQTFCFDGAAFVVSGDIYSSDHLLCRRFMAADVGWSFHSWGEYGEGVICSGHDSFEVKGGDIYSLVSRKKLSSYDLFPSAKIGDFRLESAPVEGNEFRYELINAAGEKAETRASVYLSSNTLVVFNKKARRGPVTLSCLDFGFNVLWENEDYKFVMTSPSRLDYSGFTGVGDTFVFVAGSSRDSIVALDRATGAEVWNYQMDEPCADHHLIREDLIVVIGKQTLRLLDPLTGKEINRIALPEGGWKTNVVFDGEYLYVFTTYDPYIRVYDKTGSTLVNQVLAVPEPYQFNPLDVPTVLDDQFYISLNCYSKPQDALLVVSKAELLGQVEPTLVYEDKPEIDVQCIKAPDDSDYYQVTVRGDDVDFLCRHAGVAALDIVGEYGQGPVENPNRNEDFNGLINIKLAGVAPEHRNDQDLERLAYQVQRAAKDRYFGAGANGIQAECEWVD